MMLHRYSFACPKCGAAKVIGQDRPSVASINNVLPPDARKPVPPDDRWRISVVESCSACGVSSEELNAILDREGLPKAHEVLRPGR
jgi:hypothetical protein